ncbi:hypothetical protein DDT52_16415 [Brenneria roseae subsp. roseae]|nr:hypothetical protein DDT52_16415 [Brenneria roseae subsp. roseae]
MRRRTHRRAFTPQVNRAGRGEPNKFRRPSERKAIAHDSGLFGGRQPRTPSRLSLRPKAGSVARPPSLKAFSHFFAWPERTKEKIGEKRRLKGGGRA